MIIYNAHVPIVQLYEGVGRSESWWNKHTNMGRMLNALIKSIQKDGIKHPLNCANIKDDGTYRVNCGNCRLAASKRIGLKTLPCLVFCTEGQKNNPEGEVVDEDGIQKLYSDLKINILAMDNNTFEVHHNKPWSPEQF